MLRRWKQLRENRMVEDVFDNAFGKPSYRHIKSWSIEELHRRLATDDLHPAERRMAESQVRIKEAWRTPQRWTLVIAIIAIIISIAGLIL